MFAWIAASKIGRSFSGRFTGRATEAPDDTSAITVRLLARSARLSRRTSLSRFLRASSQSVQRSKQLNLVHFLKDTKAGSRTFSGGIQDVSVQEKTVHSLDSGWLVMVDLVWVEAHFPDSLYIFRIMLGIQRVR